MTELMTRDLISGADVAGNRDLYLTITDQHDDAAEPYRRYLATTTTYPSDEPPEEQDLKVATVQFNSIVDFDTGDTRDLTSGWIYLFLNGRLWREIEVQKDGRYQDVNLNRYTGQAEGSRPAECLARDTVVIPVSYAGEPYQLQAAYSEEQWSWARINEQGGFESGKADRQAQADDNDHRNQRCTRLDYFQQEASDENYAVTLLSVEDYQLMNQPKQKLIFSLPNWLAMGRTYRDAHNEIIGEIVHLQQSLSDIDYYRTQLAPGPNQDTLAQFQVDKLQLALFTVKEVCYGQVKINAQNSHRAYLNKTLFDEATQQQMEAGKKRLSHSRLLDFDKLEDVLHTKRFKKLHAKANGVPGGEGFNAIGGETEGIKQRFIEFLEIPALIAAFRDYATLGSDDKAATRIKGLVAFAEMFDGFNVCAFRLIEPYLVSSQDYKHYSSRQVRNRMTGFLPMLLNLDQNPIELYHLLFDFERLYPELHASFIGNSQAYMTQDPATQTFAARYNPVNRGIADELAEDIGQSQAQTLLGRLFKLLAGFMVLEETELDTIARSNTPIADRMKLSETDGYDNVIQEQKDGIRTIQDDIDELEKKKLGLQEIQRNSDTQVRRLQSEVKGFQKQKDALEAQFNLSIPTQTELTELQNLKARINIQEHTIKNLQIDLDDTERQLHSIEQNLSISRQKAGRRSANRRSHRANTQKMTASTRHSNISDGLGTKNHLKIGEMTHFIGGSRVVQVRMDIDDLLEGRLPPHLIPTNPKALESLQRRRSETLARLKNNSGPRVKVKSLGMTFPVSAEVIKNRPDETQWLLSSIAANMLDSKASTPKATVNLYCFRADIDISLSERQWNTLQQVKLNQALYDDYLSAHETYKTQHLNFVDEQKKLSELQEKLDAIVQDQNNKLETVETYRASNARLIRQDRNIHWVQGPLQGVVLVFDLANMTQRWQAALKEGSFKAWCEIGTAVIDVAGSTVDVAESWTRTRAASHKFNYHNLTDYGRANFRFWGRSLGIAGGLISCIYGYLDLQTSLILNDNFRLLGSILDMVSGVGIIASIIIGTVAGLAGAAWLATAGVVLGLVSLAAGLVAAVFSFYYRDSEQTHWEHSLFGNNHVAHRETEGLQNWDNPKTCYLGLFTLQCQPQIDILDEEEWITIRVQTGALSMTSTPVIELDIKDDASFGSESHRPWLPLHNAAIAQAQQTPNREPEKVSITASQLDATFGVDWYRLAKGAQITQRGTLTEYRFARDLFVEMHQNMDVTDFLFQVRVRGIDKDHQTDLPVPYQLNDFDSSKDALRNDVKQNRYFAADIQSWWFQQQRELSIVQWWH